MGKCYCDYCDVFLTNDSVAVRKQHNDGNRHKYNVCEYYRQYVGQQLQEQIDEIVSQFEHKVSQGLIRPSYGLPPSTTKPTPDEGKNKPQSDNGQETEKPTPTETENEEKSPSDPIVESADGNVETADGETEELKEAPIQADDNVLEKLRDDEKQLAHTNSSSTALTNS